MIDLTVTLDDGHEFRVDTNRCRDCQTPFWTRSDSPEFLPKFCPYCGIRFDEITINDGPKREYK